ncbi:putative hypothetical [Escherichia coli 2875150]|nr:putative hypothetical [Escherichia coli 2875150]
MKANSAPHDDFFPLLIINNHHNIIVENFGDLHVHSKDLFYKQKNPTSPVFSGYVRFCLRMQ